MDSQQEKFEQAARSAEPDKPGRGWRYWAKRIVIDLVIAYVLICVGMYFLQRRIVYQGEQAAELKAVECGFGPAQARDISAQTGGGAALNGWHIVGPGGPELSKAPLVELFFCGNGGNRSGRVAPFRRQVSLGAHVVCFDYRGYGDSPGSPSEEGLAQDARAAWDFLRGQGVPAASIVIHGESMGGAVATRLAAELCNEKTPPAALVVEATFTRLSDVAGRHYPWLPVRLILTERFPSIERMPQITCPLLMLHGKLDNVVPFQLGQALFAAAPEKSAAGIPKQFVELPECAHNDVGQRNAIEYRQAMRAFLVKLFPVLEQKPAPREKAHAAPLKKDAPGPAEPNKPGAHRRPRSSPKNAPAPTAERLPQTDAQDPK